MDDKYHLQRFLEAQHVAYRFALYEMQHGKKHAHWIWYIFPQLAALGHSRRALVYGIIGRAEAEAYLLHPVLGERLREVSHALLEHKDKTAADIFGETDAPKVHACMTLFDAISPTDVFAEVLDFFYDGKPDNKTLENL